MALIDHPAGNRFSRAFSCYWRVTSRIHCLLPLLRLECSGRRCASASNPKHISSQHSSHLEPPSGQLRIASNETTNFTAALFTAAAQVFPSTLLSTGGDEVNLPCYEMDSVTQQQLGGRSIEDALNTFVTSTHAALRAQGKTPVVWEG